MKCPNDQTTLLLSERSGIEIDYCPECRGVWLDRGELDKLIEKSSAPASPMHSEREYQAPKQNDHHYEQRHPKKRRESFLGDLFDF